MFANNTTTTFSPQVINGYSCQQSIEWHAFPEIIYILAACHYGVAIVGIVINLLAIYKYCALLRKESLTKELALVTIFAAVFWLLSLVGFTLNWHVSCVIGSFNRSQNYQLSMALAFYPDIFGYACFYISVALRLIQGFKDSMFAMSDKFIKRFHVSVGLALVLIIANIIPWQLFIPSQYMIIVHRNILLSLIIGFILYITFSIVLVRTLIKKCIQFHSFIVSDDDQIQITQIPVRASNDDDDGPRIGGGDTVNNGSKNKTSVTSPNKQTMKTTHRKNTSDSANRMAQQLQKMVIKLTVLYSITFVHSMLVGCFLCLLLIMNMWFIGQKIAGMIFFFHRLFFMMDISISSLCNFLQNDFASNFYGKCCKVCDNFIANRYARR